MRRLVLALLVLLAVPARADDPVLDLPTREELAATLAEATEVQHICYGYDLDVTDDSDGQWGGFWSASSLGEGLAPNDSSRCTGTVLLHASITYTSSSSESEDSASWEIESTLGPPYTEELKRLGLKAGDLVKDGKAETTLANAVLALPVLVADDGLAPPVLEDATDLPSAPPDALATGRPGSDWWRENGSTLAVLLLLLAGAGVWATTTTPTGHRRARAVLRALKDS